MVQTQDAQERGLSGSGARLGAGTTHEGAPLGVRGREAGLWGGTHAHVPGPERHPVHPAPTPLPRGMLVVPSTVCPETSMDIISASVTTVKTMLCTR